jgi:hypothetical protein
MHMKSICWRHEVLKSMHDSDGKTIYFASHKRNEMPFIVVGIQRLLYTLQNSVVDHLIIDPLCDM